MAYLDERIWCHPKFADLSDRAFRVYVNSIAYSSGFSRRGVLTPGQQRTIGADKRSRAELVGARLWDERGDGIYVHDWDDYNEKRDERREKDRERKRRQRQNERDIGGMSAGTSTGKPGTVSAGPARVNGSKGSDGSDLKPDRPVEEQNLGGLETLSFGHALRLFAAVRDDHKDDQTRQVILSYAGKLPPAAFENVREELELKRRGIRHEGRWVNAALRRVLEGVAA